MYDRGVKNYSQEISDEAKDLISKLLQKEGKNRLALDKVTSADVNASACPHICAKQNSMAFFLSYVGFQSQFPITDTE